MTPIKKLKQELKQLALEIKTNKPVFKEWQRRQHENRPILATWQWPTTLSHKYRVKHIVYCLLRGRTIEQIEPTNRPFNSLESNFRLKHDVNKFMKEMNDEIVRYNSGGSVEITTSSASGTCSSGIPAEHNQPSGLGQRDTSVPESTKRGLLGRVKEFFV